MELNDDLKLKLLHGLPIPLDGIEIAPFTLGEITKLGFTKYWQYISILTTKKDNLISRDSEAYERLSSLDVLANMPGSEIFVEALKTVFRTNKIRKFFDEEQDTTVLFINDKNINSEMFDQIQQILIWQNNIESKQKEDFNPADEETAKLIEELQRQREIVSKHKSKDKTSSFSSQVEALATKSNDLNIFTVFDLTMYQFTKVFNRTIIIDNYETQVMAMLQGADVKDLKHWTEGEN